MTNKPLDAMTQRVLNLWREVLDALESDVNKLAGTVDWVTKKSVLDSYRLRDSLDWHDSKLKAIDLQYADIRTDKGLFYLMQQNSDVPAFLTEGEIERAIKNPPTDTRAYVRGKAVQNYGASVVGASWESLIFQISPSEPLKRIGLPDARGYGAIDTEHLFSTPAEPAQFISNFERHINKQH
jgi:proteasome accessory factor A